MGDRSSGGVVIEGSLTASYDDDSSDDERDDNEQSAPIVSYHAGADAVADTNIDEEELEVFCNEAAIRTVGSERSQKPNAQAESSLVDAMMVSVTQVEKSGNYIQNSSKTSIPVVPSKGSDLASTKKSIATALVEGNAPDGT